MTRQQAKGHVSMCLANVFWGLVAPFAKMVMIGGLVTPLAVMSMRIMGAMVLFWLTSLFLPGEKMSRRDLATLFGAALFGVVLNQAGYVFGVGLTSPTDAAIITTSMPLWAMILAAFLLKEPVTAMKAGGIAAGAAGALLLVWDSHARGAAGPYALWGNLLVLSAQVFYAFYLVAYKNFVSRYSLMTVMKWMFAFSGLCILPLAAPEFARLPWTELSGRDVWMLFFIVAGGTWASYALIVIAQRALRPTVAGMYTYVQPIVACAMAVFLGLDVLTFGKLAAVALIFAGVALVTLSPARADKTQGEKGGATQP